MSNDKATNIIDVSLYIRTEYELLVKSLTPNKITNNYLRAIIVSCSRKSEARPKFK